MSVCPKCGYEITSLRWSEKAVRFGSYDLVSGYSIDSVESAGNDEFNCPDCDEVLFINEEKAKEFLNGS